MSRLSFVQWLGIVKITVGIAAVNEPFAVPLLASAFFGGWHGAPLWIFFALMIGGVVSIAAGAGDLVGWRTLRDRALDRGEPSDD